MQTITPHVMISKDYSGITTGAVISSHEIVLIDAPFLAEDIRRWKDSIYGMSASSDRMLISLDEHNDRTIGCRQIECTVIAHEKIIQFFKDRPASSKPQGLETGSEWEKTTSPVNTRWINPEITFSDQMNLYREGILIELFYRPGPSTCSLWASIPSEKIVFVGDSVLPNTPPFLANASLPDWRTSLTELLKPKYRDFKIISGREGELSVQDVKNQLKLLEKFEKQLEKLSTQNLRAGDIIKTTHNLLKHYKYPVTKEPLYSSRIRWGIINYLAKHYGLAVPAVE